MWIEQFFYEIDKLKERIKLIEEFLGGEESMKKVLENRKVNKVVENNKSDSNDN